MANTMSQNTRNEYLEMMRDRYRRYTGRQARSKLITEFCEVTSHERKYAIKLLRGQRGPGSAPPAKRGVHNTYGQEVIDVLFVIWSNSEQPCGKRLKPMLKEWLPHYQAHHGPLSQQTHDQVLAISPAQIDRVLAERKIGVSKRKPRTPKPNAAIKALVPIRAESWDAKEPGWLEADTVAHCGGHMAESFIWSLTVTDIFSGWTEVRPSWNRGQQNVLHAFSAIETQLPFTMLGVDTDNGGEFLNYHLHDHFTNRSRPIEMTRSRPYRKNDQAHVEQKNDTHVRQLLGYDRLGHQPLMTLTWDLLEAWSLWRNLFTTSFKQIETRREGTRQIRVHEKVPQTPCQRLIDHHRAQGNKAYAQQLEHWRSQHDPFKLKAWIEEQLRRIWDLNKELECMDGASELEKEESAEQILTQAQNRSAPIKEIPTLKVLKPTKIRATKKIS